MSAGERSSSCHRSYSSRLGFVRGFLSIFLDRRSLASASNLHVLHSVTNKSHTHAHTHTQSTHTHTHTLGIALGPYTVALASAPDDQRRATMRWMVFEQRDSSIWNADCKEGDLERPAKRTLTHTHTRTPIHTHTHTHTHTHVHTRACTHAARAHRPTKKKSQKIGTGGGWTTR